MAIDNYLLDQKNLVSSGMAIDDYRSVNFLEAIDLVMVV